MEPHSQGVTPVETVSNECESRLVCIKLHVMLQSAAVVPLSCRKAKQENVKKQIIALTKSNFPAPFRLPLFQRPMEKSRAPVAGFLCTAMW